METRGKLAELRDKLMLRYHIVEIQCTSEPWRQHNVIGDYLRYSNGKRTKARKSFTGDDRWRGLL